MAAQYTWLSSYIDKLHRSIVSGKPYSPLLIQGLSGVGKSFTASCYGRMLLCEYHSNDSCCLCRACQLIKSGLHPDLTVIEPQEKGKSIGVDTIRSAINKLGLSSYRQSYRVLIVRHSECLTIQAANSLLKFLEAHGFGVITIFTLDIPGSIPVTLRSRCQTLDIGIPELPATLAFLREQGVSGDDLALCAKLACGAPVKALEIANDGNLLLQRKNFLKDLLNCGKGRSTPSLLSEKWNTITVQDLVSWMRPWIVDFIRSQSFASGTMKLVSKHDLEGSEFTAFLSINQGMELMDVIRNMESQDGRQLNNRMVLESFLCKWCDICDSA